MFECKNVTPSSFSYIKMSISTNIRLRMSKFKVTSGQIIAHSRQQSVIKLFGSMMKYYTSIHLTIHAFATRTSKPLKERARYPVVLWWGYAMETFSALLDFARGVDWPPPIKFQIGRYHRLSFSLTWASCWVNSRVVDDWRYLFAHWVIWEVESQGPHWV